VANHSVKATNWATTSTNKIHDDDVARRYGFRGGLVPGVTVFAYMLNPIVASLGSAFPERGWADIRFNSPVYDGDMVCASVSEGRVSLSDSSGAVCATGTFGLDGRVGATDVPSAPSCVDRPPASEESLAPGTVLGSIEHGFHTAKAGTFLSGIGEDLPVYSELGVAHPGWLLLDANDVLSANVVLGPWIHVGSRTRQLRPVTDGQHVSTRGRVADCYSRKGHSFVELDIVVVADDEPAMSIRHTAIWRVREER
jgi:acyl dehydratase